MLLPEQARLQQDIEHSLSKILDLVRISSGELHLSDEVLCTVATDVSILTCDISTDVLVKLMLHLQMWKALIVGLAQLEGSTVDDEAEALMCLNARGYPAGPCSNMWRPGQLAVRCLMRWDCSVKGHRSWNSGAVGKRRPFCSHAGASSARGLTALRSVWNVTRYAQCKSCSCSIPQSGPAWPCGTALSNISSCHYWLHAAAGQLP